MDMHNRNRRRMTACVGLRAHSRAALRSALARELPSEDSPRMYPACFHLNTHLIHTVQYVGIMHYDRSTAGNISCDDKHMHKTIKKYKSTCAAAPGALVWRRSQGGGHGPPPLGSAPAGCQPCCLRPHHHARCVGAAPGRIRGAQLQGAVWLNSIKPKARRGMKAMKDDGSRGCMGGDGIWL